MLKTTTEFSTSLVRASSLRVLGKLAARVLDFGTLLVLARMLSPDDFGVVALAMSLIYVVEMVTSLPLSSAMLSARKVKNSMYDTAFSLGLIRGLFLACFLSTCAFFVSNFYQEPRLLLLTILLSLAPAFRGLVSPRMVDYLRNMDFRHLTLIELLGKFLASALSIIVALTTHSYWAIAVSIITTPLVITVLSYFFAPYRPRFTLADWLFFRSYVGWNAFIQVMEALNWQMDLIFMGKLVSSKMLGQYSMGVNIVGILHQAIVVPVAQPLLSSFSKMNNESNMNLLKGKYIQSIGAIFMLVAPIYLFVCLFAENLILVILGEKWIEAAFFLQALALISLIRLPVRQFGFLAIALNRLQVNAVCVFLEFLISLPLMIFLGLKYGVNGVLSAKLVSSLVALILGLVGAKMIVEANMMSQIKTLLRTIAGLLAFALAVVILKPMISDDNIYLLVFHSLSVAITGFIAYTATIGLTWHICGRPDGLEPLIMKLLSDVKGTLLSKARF